MVHGRYAAAAALLALSGLAACSSDQPEPLAPSTAAAGKSTGMMGINVVLNAPITDAARATLATYGRILDELPGINALTMRVDATQLAALQGLSIVAAATPDAERQGSPIDPLVATNFAAGYSTWDQDAVNVTSGPGANKRSVSQTGAGVWVGVLDTGLLDSWRQYFPDERIAEEYGIAFGGGGGERGNVSEQPNKWEHDQNSHGTHVTSSIIGYSLNGTPIGGVAPMATIIPVKVLGQNGSGWSSVIARGIEYITDLKLSGALGSKSVVINMSLGGGSLDAIEQAAIDRAIANGVIIVAAAGNSGAAGMGYPGAYAPVISVAASQWKLQFTTPTWWNALDVPEDDATFASQFTIASFSSRKTRAAHDLDVAAPGANVVGPYQTNSGQLSYFYLSGTSMATPHVAGVVALMIEKKNSLGAAEAETRLETTALSIPGVSVNAQGSGMVLADRVLGSM